MNFLPHALRLCSLSCNPFQSKTRRRRTGQVGVLERLESRQLLTTFVVTSTDDTTDPGTLRWAIDQANNSAGADSIEFDASFASPQTITLNGTQLPEISDTTGATTITSPQGSLVTVDANQLSRVFEIEFDAELKLDRFRIINGNAGDDDGGAVLSRGTFTAQTVTFESNVAANGGAVSSDGGGLLIEVSTFTGNTANDGGAIFAQDLFRSAVVYNTYFGGNSATDRGGAVHLSYGRLNVLAGMFEGNTADDGGAIANAHGTLSVESAIFLHNTAMSAGGAVWNNDINHPIDANALIRSSAFIENAADFGGGIWNAATLTLEHAVFNDNTADEGGGVDSRGTLLAASSTFTANHADSDGGGLYSYGSAVLDTCTFTSNTAGRGGGGAQAGNWVNVVDSTFTANTAPSAGGISCGGTVSISGSTFDSNLATAETGVAGGVGFGIGSLSLTGTVIKNNRANWGAGYFGQGQVYANYVEFTDNVATDRGGAIFTSDGCSFSGTQLTISGNTALQGGGIFASTSSSNIDLRYANIHDNTAVFGGGIYISEASHLEMTLSLVNGNSAEQGGGLFNLGAVQIDNSTFTQNSATQGGAIFHGHEPERNPVFGLAELVAVNVTIADNHVTDAGGGIYQTAIDEGAVLVNTIIARNDRDGVANDIAGIVDTVRSANNLVVAGATGGLTDGVNGNIVLAAGEFLGLAELADNGGNTQTMALLPGSPAVDSGTPEILTAVPYRFYDQRYTNDFFRHQGGGIDIGAFESAYAVQRGERFENETFATQFSPYQVGLPPFTYTIVGGEDQALFSVDPSTGIVSFLSAPDFENPQDSDHDNVYHVRGSVTNDSGKIFLQDVFLTILDRTPILNLNPDPVEYVVGADPVPVDSGALYFPALGDPETRQAKLVVSVPTNADPKDKIEFLGKGKNGGPLRIKKNSILFNDVVVGTIEKRTKVATDLTIRFNSQTTTDAIQAIVRQIGFSTKNKTAGQPLRTVKLQIFESDSKVSATATRQVSVVVDL